MEAAEENEWRCGCLLLLLSAPLTASNVAPAAGVFWGRARVKAGAKVTASSGSSSRCEPLLPCSRQHCTVVAAGASHTPCVCGYVCVRAPARVSHVR